MACDRETLERAISGSPELADYIQATVPANWTAFGTRALQYSLDKLNASENEKNWWSYFVIHKADSVLVGLCGYKGQPNELGLVEIGYEIKADYRLKGLATELVRALIDNAFASGRVQCIQAHTLGEINASTNILVKCGFQKITEITDPQHGKIWKWELK